MLNSIRLVLTYGPQEYDPKEVIDEFYQNDMVQIERALGPGDSVCLTGDLNAKLGNVITLSDIHEISPNGKILRDLVCKYNLSVIDATDYVKGRLQESIMKTLLKDQLLIMLLY